MKVLFQFLFPFLLIPIVLTSASFSQQANDLQEKITIQLKWRHQFQFAGYYAAIEKGFYADEGLDVTLRERDMSSDYVMDVISGKAEYGTADAGLLLYRAKGEPVVLLKQIFQHSPLIFIAKKGSGIISPYEMIGKKVRFDPGSGNFAPLTASLVETIGSASQVIPERQSYDLESFIKGNVDVISAYLTEQPFRLQKMGVDFTIINPVNYGVDFYGDNFFTTNEEIHDHPGRVKKMIRATLKGWQYALNHKEEIIDIISTKYAPDLGRDLLVHEAKMTEMMIIPELVELGSVNPLRYDRIAYLYAGIGLLDKPVVPEGFVYQEPQITLTSAESTWLSEHSVIQTGVVLEGEPMVFTEKNGHLEGLLGDYILKLEASLGVHFHCVLGTWDDLHEKIRNRQIDVILNAETTVSTKDNENLLFGDPYMGMAIGIFAGAPVNYISNLDLLSGRKVAVLLDTEIEDLLQEHYPQIEVVPVANIQEGLTCINNGEVFAFINEVLTTFHAIRQRGYTQIHMAGETPFSNSISMAVSPKSAIVLRILQKAITQIPPNERVDIYNKWVPLTHKEPTDYWWLWRIGAGFLVAAILILAWNRKLAYEVKKQTVSLKESEELFRTLFEDHSAVKFIIDPDDGKITNANKSAAEYYGWSQDQLKQMRIQDINTLSPDLVQKEIENVNDNERQYFEFRHRLADGSIRDVAVFSSKINYKGKILLHSIIHDITAQKSAEADRERLEIQFRQAQKLEAVGQLAGGVAHDYNNMLSVILGYTELALDDADAASPMHGYLTQVFDAAKRSEDITRQLLAFARKQTVEPKVLNLNNTIAGMLKMLRRLIGEDIDLAWMPNKDGCPVFMDPTQIDQVLVNLCVNARDAITGSGKVTIETVEVTIDEEYCTEHHSFIPGDFVVLAISDDGCGMDKEIADKIFEPFYTTKGLGRGTGLGLSTVYGIVKQNNGFINVYSELGEGTTFKIYLPKYQGVIEEPAKSVDVSPHACGETVLLVEDEESILHLGKKILTDLGYTVITANTPTKAIQLAQSQKREIDILITDVVMPEMNGRQLSEKLQERYPRLKTLYMSGYTANVIAHHGVLDKGVHFIPKPLSRQMLAMKVREALA